MVIDITNNKYGKLIVIGLHHIDIRRKSFWLCECSCGNTIIRRGDSLKSGSYPSCGCYKFKSGVKVNRLKKVYGRLTVIKETNKRDNNGNIKWLCECVCGNHVIVSGNNLQQGTTKSCGCLNTETRRKQGLNNKGSNNGMFGKFKELHHNWKGKTHRTNQDRLRKSKEYKDWRNRVFERDNYICQKCGQYGLELNAHHKYSFSLYTAKRFDINNGITLCKKCHLEVHSTQGRFTNGEVDSFGSDEEIVKTY